MKPTGHCRDGSPRGFLQEHQYGGFDLVDLENTGGVGGGRPLPAGNIGTFLQQDRFAGRDMIRFPLELAKAAPTPPPPTPCFFPIFTDCDLGQFGSIPWANVTQANLAVSGSDFTVGTPPHLPARLLSCTSLAVSGNTFAHYATLSALVSGGMIQVTAIAQPVSGALFCDVAFWTAMQLGIGTLAIAINVTSNVPTPFESTNMHIGLYRISDGQLMATFTKTENPAAFPVTYTGTMTIVKDDAYYLLVHLNAGTSNPATSMHVVGTLTASNGMTLCPPRAPYTSGADILYADCP